MQKKILVLTGSARKEGNSNRMARAFVAAAEAKGHAVKLIDTSKLKLNFCHACETCYKTGKPCSFDDDFNTIAEDILALLREPCCFEDLLQKIFTKYSLTMTFEQYALVGSTVRSYLAWLKDEGRIGADFDNNRLLWKRV